MHRNEGGFEIHSVYCTKCWAICWSIIKSLKVLQLEYCILFCIICIFSIFAQNWEFFISSYLYILYIYIIYNKHTGCPTKKFMIEFAAIFSVFFCSYTHIICFQQTFFWGNRKRNRTMINSIYICIYLNIYVSIYVSMYLSMYLCIYVFI